MTDAKTCAVIFAAAAEGVMYPFTGTPEERRQRNAWLDAHPGETWVERRQWRTEDRERARSMSGAFKAIADVFSKIAEAEDA